jgi:hypothetical protein
LHFPLAGISLNINDLDKGIQTADMHVKRKVALHLYFALLIAYHALQESTNRSHP